jgi:anthranilate phosphoribosyltransferase
MGVYQSRLVPLVAEAMTMLGVQHAFVVHGDQGLDEIALSGPSEVAEVRADKSASLEGSHAHVRLHTISPVDFGVDEAPRETLTGGDAATNAAILRTIFSGKPGPPRNVVLLNAAAVLVTAGLARDMRSGVSLAAQTIDSGAVTSLVSALSS